MGIVDWWWPSRIVTHREASGKAIRSPFLPLTSLISSNRKPKHQHDKSARWGGEGGGALEARNPGTTARVLLLPQKILNTNTVMCNKNKKTFRKNPLGDLVNHLCRLERHL